MNQPDPYVPPFRPPDPGGAPATAPAAPVDPRRILDLGHEAAAHLQRIQKSAPLPDHTKAALFLAEPDADGRTMLGAAYSFDTEDLCFQLLRWLGRQDRVTIALATERVRRAQRLERAYQAAGKRRGRGPSVKRRKPGSKYHG